MVQRSARCGCGQRAMTEGVRMQTLLRVGCRAAVAVAAAIAALLALQQGPLAAGPQPGVKFAQAGTAGQPELVDRALAELQPSTDGAGHLYFVGFAGYGPAAVFMR